MTSAAAMGTPGGDGAAGPALQARADALESSGWGNRVHWWQPRNACLWVYLVGLGYGVYGLFAYVNPTIGAYGTALGLSAVIFAAYGAVFWWFTAVIDRYSPQPAALRVAAFLWGGLVATWVIGLNANNALIALWTKAFGQQEGTGWAPALSAPFSEEWGKGAGVLLLLFIAPTVVRTAYDGFVLGAFVGLGFEVFEDASYALNAASEAFGVDPVGNSLHTVVLRLLTGFTSHILYSAIFGAGVVYLVGTRARPRRIARGLVLCLLAMLLHGLWDATGAIGAGNGKVVLTLIVVLTVAALAAVVTVFHLVIGPERATMRAVLAPEVEDGTITAEELDAVSGSWRARRRYRTSAASRADRRRRRHRLAATRDLADEIAAGRGAETERVAYARAELARLRPPAAATPT